MKLIIHFIIVLLVHFNPCRFLFGQSNAIEFGSEIQLSQVTPGSKNKGNTVSWINVNTDPGTFKKNKDLLICTGLPIGVMRSEKQYENFILEIEWRHMTAGGNSGV